MPIARPIGPTAWRREARSDGEEMRDARPIIIVAPGETTGGASAGRTGGKRNGTTAEMREGKTPTTTSAETREGSGGASERNGEGMEDVRSGVSE